MGFQTGWEIKRTVIFVSEVAYVMFRSYTLGNRQNNFQRDRKWLKSAVFNHGLSHLVYLPLCRPTEQTNNGYSGNATNIESTLENIDDSLNMHGLLAGINRDDIIENQNAMIIDIW